MKVSFVRGIFYAYFQVSSKFIAIGASLLAAGLVDYVADHHSGRLGVHLGSNVLPLRNEAAKLALLLMTNGES